MDTEVDELVRSVKRVSLGNVLRKQVVRSPSFEGLEDDAMSLQSEDAKSGSEPTGKPGHLVEDLHATNPVHEGTTPQRGDGDPTGYHLSSVSWDTETMSLRRGGVRSTGLREEMTSLVRSCLLITLLFIVTEGGLLNRRLESIARIIAVASCLFTCVSQISVLLHLASCRLLRGGNSSAGAPHGTPRRPMRRGNLQDTSPSHTRYRKITAVDKVDNVILRVCVWMVLVVARTAVVVLCIAFLAFCTRNYDSTRQDSSPPQRISMWLRALTVPSLKLQFEEWKAAYDAPFPSREYCDTIPKLLFQRQIAEL